MSIWYILCPFGIIYDRLVEFVVIWFIFNLFKIWKTCTQSKNAKSHSSLVLNFLDRTPIDLSRSIWYRNFAALLMYVCTYL
jgi:hypothetical protein